MIRRIDVEVEVRQRKVDHVGVCTEIDAFIDTTATDNDVHGSAMERAVNQEIESWTFFQGDLTGSTVLGKKP